MRTGGDYRKALRDGRKVWVMGEGWVDDVTTHPATRAMVEEYALWYDRHLDPAWHELLLAPPNADGARIAQLVQLAAPQLQGLQYAGQCGPARDRSADAGDRAAHQARLFLKAGSCEL